jgi:hypothetical protein
MEEEEKTHMFRSLTSGGKQRGQCTCKANIALRMETMLHVLI